MNSDTPAPNPHSTAFVQQHLPTIVEQLKRDGMDATPLVFGSEEPDAVLISADQYRALIEEFDDLLDKGRLRQRLDSAPNDDDLELTSTEDLARTLGIDEPRN